MEDRNSLVKKMEDGSYQINDIDTILIDETGTDIPMVSVTMITYKHQNFIGEAIEGVLMQKTNFKFVLVIGEDCGADNTRQIILNYQKNYPDKIILKLPKNNLGIIENSISNNMFCNGRYIAVCEGDDYWTDPLKLQKQVDFMEANPDYSMCFTRFKTLQQNSNVFKDDLNSKYFQNDVLDIDFNFEIFAKGWHVGTQTLFFRNDMFDVNLILNYKYFRDVHLFTELLKKGKGKCLNFFGAVYRLHDGGIHSSINELQVYKIGSLCYEELYRKNKNIKALRIKYYFFKKRYIDLLVQSSLFISAFMNVLEFSILERDFYFFKMKVSKIVKIVLKRIKTKIL